jgi:hypothetical protein
METIYSTDQLIEELISASHGDNISAREKHAFREALRGLVRLAKAEQILAMKTDIKKLPQISCDTLHSH